MQKTRKANSMLAKMKGLMFEKKTLFDYALLFEMEKETRIQCSIHMLFVFFPIDVVFLDSSRKVVEIAENLVPFALLYTPKKPAKYFVELPEGKAKEASIGDELEWN